MEKLNWWLIDTHREITEYHAIDRLIRPRTSTPCPYPFLFRHAFPRYFYLMTPTNDKPTREAESNVKRRKKGATTRPRSTEK
jgi:hypothetical protein